MPIRVKVDLESVTIDTGGHELVSSKCGGKNVYLNFQRSVLREKQTHFQTLKNKKVDSY